MFNVDDSRALLTAAHLFFGPDDADTPEEAARNAQTLLMNDAFGWGTADAEYVSDDELPRVGELFWRYGNCGILYWVVVEKRGDITPEFEDVRRHIEFVRQEESIRKSEPFSSTRAYLKHTYTIGGW